MREKARRLTIGAVLAAALAVGAVFYATKHGHTANHAVADTRQTPAAGGAGQAVNRYDGPTVNVYYGYVRVQAVVKNRKLSNVVVLEHPNDNGTSRYINHVAMPYLVREAVQTQSAQIQLISGATFSSEGFVRSLGGALSKAGL